VSGRPTAAERLSIPDAVLSRTDLRDLGYGRQAVDRIFRACAVIVPPGSRKPLILVRDYHACVAAWTFHDGERVR
jgi:hypothetical protein